MHAFPLKRMAVIGGDACAWLAAAALARVLGDSCAVHVLEPPEQPGGALASVPTLHRLLRLLGIDEPALMRAASGSYRLGAEFRDWGAPGENFFQGFGAVGAALQGIGFHHHWLRVASRGPMQSPDAFSVAAQAARRGRFALPQADPRSLLSRYAYAWHFDAAELTAFLRDQALALGVTCSQGEPAAPAFAEDGSLRELRLREGLALGADFFVDASGAGDVLRPLLDVSWESWSDWLPCDRMVSMRVASRVPPAPFSSQTAVAEGWIQEIPLANGVEKSLVYSSAMLAEDEAIAKLLATHDAEPRAVRQPAALKCGRPREFWSRNVLLLPGASLDPIAATSLHLAQTGITRLLAHFPSQPLSPRDAAEYNRLTGAEYDRLRDLLATHFVRTRRAGTLWQRCRDAQLPATLEDRLALFAESGRLSIGEEEHCGEDGWLALLLGLGIRPRAWDPLADTLPFEGVRTALAQFAAQVGAAAESLPPYAPPARRNP